MDNFFSNVNINLLILILIAIVALLFIITIVLIVKYTALNKRINYFVRTTSKNFNIENSLTKALDDIEKSNTTITNHMKATKTEVGILKDNHNTEIEKMKNQHKTEIDTLKDSHDKEITNIKEVYNKEIDNIKEMIEYINKNLQICIQKTGVVRYNPFKDVGGELCFALAFLDKNNDGFILNTIFTDAGCYTYCKPVTDSTSSIKLSDEEKEAIILAKNKTF